MKNHIAIIIIICSFSFAQSAVADKNVPNVFGKSLIEATEVLKDSKLGVKGPLKRLSMKGIGTVIEQRPLSGEKVKEGSSVLLTLSLGAVIPDYIGREAMEVADLLNSYGYKVSVTNENIEGVEKGLIGKQSPSAHVLFDASTTEVSVSASNGPWIVLKDVKGLSENVASSVLVEQKFSVSVIPAAPDLSNVITGNGQGDTTCSLCSRSSVVNSTNPAAGTLLFPGNQVKIVMENTMFCTVEPCACSGVGCILK